MANTVNLYFEVTKQAIKRKDEEFVASGAINTLVANFEFCNTWAGLYKFCRFEGNGSVVDVRIEDDKCVIPWEVLEAPGFTMACYGTISTDVMLTTAKLSVRVHKSINFIANEPLPPTPALIERYEQLIEQAMDIASDIQQRADNGDFNGRDGIIATVPGGMFALQIDASNGHLYAYYEE